MKYRIEEYKLKNGIEDISIIFDEKYQLLTTFMSCDVLPFEKWIKSGFDRVLSGKSEYEEVNGNVCYFDRVGSGGAGGRDSGRT